MQILQEMFPSTPNGMIRSLRTENTMIIEKIKAITLPILLARHASEVMDGDEDVLKKNRHVLWNKTEVFYQQSIAIPTS